MTESRILAANNSSKEIRTPPHSHIWTPIGAVFRILERCSKLRQSRVYMKITVEVSSLSETLPRPTASVAQSRVSRSVSATITKIHSAGYSRLSNVLQRPSTTPSKVSFRFIAQVETIRTRLLLVSKEFYRGAGKTQRDLLLGSVAIAREAALITFRRAVSMPTVDYNMEGIRVEIQIIIYWWEKVQSAPSHRGKTS